MRETNLENIKNHPNNFFCGTEREKSTMALERPTSQKQRMNGKFQLPS